MYIMRVTADAQSEGIITDTELFFPFRKEAMNIPAEEPSVIKYAAMRRADIGETVSSPSLKNAVKQARMESPIRSRADAA